MTGTQQEMYDSWIRDSDVFILVVSKSGIGEWTENEIAIAAKRKKTQNIKTLAFVQNGAEDGGAAENERWKTALSEYKDCFDVLEHYDNVSDLYNKAKEQIEALRSNTSIGTVIKDCLRVGYDIVITGISEKSMEYVYSLADKFNIINNENFRENEKNSLIFNLQINLDDLSNIRTNVNDYYFILAEGNEEATKHIGECYRNNNPYMFLDVNIKESESSGSIVSEISNEINDNYLFIFQNRETLIGKDSIRSRLEKIKRAYGDFQKGLAYYREENYFDAEGLLLEAVKFGFVDACFHLGYIYSDNEHPDFTDLSKAEKYYRIAVDRGDAAAQFNLGLFLTKIGKTSDAEKYLRAAAEQGFPFARTVLGFILLATGNISEAKKHYRMAAEQGHHYSQLLLEDLLNNNHNNRNAEKEKRYREKADRGDVNSQYDLGLLLQETGNISEAEKYYRIAAEQGHVDAQFSLGLMMHENGNLPEAIKYLCMAEEQGYAPAQSFLSLLLIGTDENSEVWKCYRMEADQGNAFVQNNLGLLLEKAGNLSEAEKYWRMAAEQGYVNAQIKLGVLLRQAGNLSEAEKYFRMAAESGQVEAQFALGLLMDEKGNLPEAEKCYRIAAEQGFVSAQYNLGTILDRTGNLSEAEKYYRMAAEQGNSLAQFSLGNLLLRAGNFS